MTILYPVPSARRHGRNGSTAAPVSFASRLVAVNDLNLEVPQGSIFGLLGPNGAGKTTTVELLDATESKSMTYQIVGEDEADIKAGKISYSSPIAKALIGKYAGDVAEVQTPGGPKELEIVDVKYE